MQTKNNLQARLSQVIDESLALLTKVYHQEPLQKTVTIPSPSLFDQCLELCAQQYKLHKNHFLYIPYITFRVRASINTTYKIKMEKNEQQP